MRILYEDPILSALLDTQISQFNELPAGSGKSSAIEGFANAITITSAGEALAWLRAVPNESERLGRLRRVWEQWADRKAAQQWIETSNELTAAERNTLRGILATP